MEKAGLRQDVQNTIKQISTANKNKENTIIFDIRQKDLLPKYNNRAVYISLSDEVDTKKIITSILSSGKKCLLPIHQGEKFFFSEINKNTQYQKNQYGIQEPTNANKSIYVPDVILVPGLAFTVQ